MKNVYKNVNILLSNINYRSSTIIGNANICIYVAVELLCANNFMRILIFVLKISIIEIYMPALF